MIRLRAWTNDFPKASLATILVIVVCTHISCARSALADGGLIRGIVLNGSRNQRPLEGAQVVLRAHIQGQYVVVEETTTDAHGRFQFEELPIDAGIQYIPGVNQRDVHYPAPRFTLTRERQTADVRIVAYESTTEANPLLIREHEIRVRPITGALEVLESMVIDNPSEFCYVGQPSDKPDRVVTLQLSIPKNFESVTFEKEFFGRRFLLINGKLLTGIPWPPGKRRLKFTYVVPNDSSNANWQRTVDLPCSELRLTVYTDKLEEVQCSLGTALSSSSDAVTFATTGGALPVGYEINLQIGDLSIPVMVYGRWTALVVLIAIVGGTSILLSRPTKSSGDNRSS